jgi:hypothetical protein
MPRKRYLPLIIGVLLLFFLILFLSLWLGGRDTEDPNNADLETGLSYLQQLETQDPQAVDDVIKYQKEQKRIAQREARLQQLESGEISVWTLFEDYVLLGDSRAVGFYYYGFLPESRVLAEGGATIRDLKEHIPDIVSLDPTNVFLCYGLNDVSIGYWDTPEAYTAEFAETIQEIQQQLPGVKIFISSILPARAPAFQTSTAWYNIPEYSSAVADMCQTIDSCYYVNNDELAEAYADLWDSDGIHVKKEFYSHWAANLITEVYDSEENSAS